jgi:hypothetical protein
MAKRKKYRKKQSNHKHKVVKNTTGVNRQPEKNQKTEEYKSNIKERIEVSTGKSTMMSDVRYSLVLLAVIIVAFALIYVALQNRSISNSIYSLIKLNNVSF